MGLSLQEFENRIGWMVIYFCVWELIVFTVVGKFSLVKWNSLSSLIFFGLFLIFLSEKSNEHTHTHSHNYECGN